MLTRRQFAIGSAAMISASIIGRRIAEPRATYFNTPLPIPRLVDAAKQGNAVSLKIAAGRHAFVHGKPVRTYGYSAPILGPAIRMRRGDQIEMTVENALDTVTTVHWHGLLGAW
jgi:blue copper oxidase